MSSVWDMILQWGSTIKVSIELPVATRHRRDMTEKLLKATLNPNTHTHTHTRKSEWAPISEQLETIDFTNKTILFLQAIVPSKFIQYTKWIDSTNNIILQNALIQQNM